MAGHFPPAFCGLDGSAGLIHSTAPSPVWSVLERCTVSRPGTVVFDGQVVPAES